MLGGVTAAVFWQVRHHEFITFDDPIYVTQNLRVQAGLTWENVIWAFQTTSESNWHPLTWLSHMLDCQWFRLNPSGHHLENVCFHLANSLLLFFVFKRMTGARWRSAFVAALFALHPLHVESVAWVAERKDVLSTLFWILTMWAYVRYAERPNLWIYVLTLGLFALGLMCKPMLVTLPCVLFLLDFWPLGRIRGWAPLASTALNVRRPSALAPLQPSGKGEGSEGEGGRGALAGLRISAAPLPRRVILEKIPFLLLMAASCVATYLAQQKGEAVVAVTAVPMAERLANATISYSRYIGKLIWPENLAIFYPYMYAWPAWQVAGATLVLIGGTLLAWWGRHKHRFLAVGWLWYLGTLVPVIGLVQVGAQSMADRYTYVPLIGLFIMIAWGAVDLSKEWRGRKMALALSAVAALLGCLGMTFFQVRIWQDSVTLFEHALAVTSESAIGHFNLGYGLLAKGRPADALVHFTAGLQRVPQSYWIHAKIGDIFLDQRKFDEAVAKYSEALRLKPDFAEAHSSLALAFAGQGKSPEAMTHFTESLRLKPEQAEFHFRFGMFLMAQQRPLEAAAQYRETLRLKPDSINALNNLAWLLATHENASIRNGPEAVSYAERACDLTGRHQAFLVGTLAAAYAEAGRFPEAVKTAQQAMEVASATGKTDLVATNRRLLELYRAGKPFHDLPVQPAGKSP